MIRVNGLREETMGADLCAGFLSTVHTPLDLQSPLRSLVFHSCGWDGLPSIQSHSCRKTYTDTQSPLTLLTKALD
jgi:hypothetical protein